MAIINQKKKTCEGCPFIEQPAIWGQGSRTAPVAVVGDYPREDAVEYGLPFSGRLSTLYTTILQRSNLTRDDVYTTYAVKCSPPENVASTSKIMTDAMMHCRPIIDKELEKLNPELVVVTGEIPLRALTAKKQIGNFRGVFLETDAGLRIMPTLSLASVFHQPKSESIIVNDFKQVGEAIEYDVKKKPKPKKITWDVADTLSSVKVWVNRLTKHKYLSVDTETTSLERSTNKIKAKKGGLLYTVYDCMLIQVGYSETESVLFPLERYLREPVYTKSELEKVKKVLQSLFEYPGIIWAIQDMMMDLRVLQKCVGVNPYKMAFRDTLIMQHILNENEPADLDSMAAIYTDMGSYKQEVNSKYAHLAKIKLPRKKAKK